MAKTIIVTGASKGIGLSIAQYLISNAHNVTLIARSNELLEEIRARHPAQVRTIAGDVSDTSLLKQALDSTVKEFGQLDGLIINHGTLEPVARVVESEVEDWKRGFDVNFFSAVALVKIALPALRKTNGRIVFTSSGVAVNGYTAWGAYGATKAALNHLALTLGAEEPEVTTISIRPGVVDTEMQRDIREVHSMSMHEKDVARYLQLHRDGGLLRPEQPGRVIAKLALDGPSELSGKFLSWNDKDLSRFQEP